MHHSCACPSSTPSLLAGGPTKILGGIEPGINPVFSDFDAVHHGPRQPGTPMSFDDFYPTLASWRVRQAVRTARTQEKNAFNTFERAKAEAIPLVNAYLAPSGDGDGPALNVPPRTFEETSAILLNVETCARMLTLSKLRVTTAERIAMAAVKRDQYGDDARLFWGDGEAGGAPYQSTRRYGNTLFCLSGPGVRPVLRRRMRCVSPNDLDLGEADWRPGEVGGGRDPRRGGDDQGDGGAGDAEEDGGGGDDGGDEGGADGGGDGGSGDGGGTGGGEDDRGGGGGEGGDGDGGGARGGGSERDEGGGGGRKGGGGGKNGEGGGGGEDERVGEGGGNGDGGESGESGGSGGDGEGGGNGGGRGDEADGAR